MRARYLAVVVVLALAGCGSQTLQQQSTGLKALAAEGGVLAGDAARGRSTTVFTREHSGFLLKSARSSAAKLARLHADGAERLARLAADVRDDLDRLAHSGSNRHEQEQLQHDFERIADKL